MVFGECVWLCSQLKCNWCRGRVLPDTLSNISMQQISMACIPANSFVIVLCSPYNEMNEHREKKHRFRFSINYMYLSSKFCSFTLCYLDLRSVACSRIGCLILNLLYLFSLYIHINGQYNCFTLSNCYALFSRLLVDVLRYNCK